MASATRRWSGVSKGDTIKTLLRVSGKPASASILVFLAVQIVGLFLLKPRAAVLDYSVAALSVRDICRNATFRVFIRTTYFEPGSMGGGPAPVLIFLHDKQR
jgi:hypothetical protein